MKRIDLRHLKNDFENRLKYAINNDLDIGEIGIFLFEVIDFSKVQISAEVVESCGAMLMNSLRFNEVDWTIIVKRLK